MPDREKVVEALKCCTQNPICTGCPYEDVGDTFAKCCLALMSDCLDLLKAQEPVKYVVRYKNADLSNGTKFARGECGGSLLHTRVNYCPWCGKPVKWE